MKPDFASMTPAELNAWYGCAVGYRPQLDDPSMTDDALRALCEEYWKEEHWHQWVADVEKAIGHELPEDGFAWEAFQRGETVEAYVAEIIG